MGARRIALLLGTASIFVGAGALVLAMRFGFLPGTAAYETRPAMTLVANSLLDPDSAKFRSISRHTFSYSDPHHISVCGEVNGKNRMNAYVGYRRFVVDVAAQKISIDPDNSESFEDAEAKMTECRDFAKDGAAAAWRDCIADFRRINDAALENQTFHTDWVLNCEFPGSKGR